MSIMLRPRRAWLSLLPSGVGKELVMNEPEYCEHCGTELVTFDQGSVHWKEEIVTREATDEEREHSLDRCVAVLKTNLADAGRRQREAVLIERKECAELVKAYALAPAWIEASAAEGIASAILAREEL
jgi:hypothetical protein